MSLVYSSSSLWGAGVVCAVGAAWAEAFFGAPAEYEARRKSAKRNRFIRPLVGKSQYFGSRRCSKVQECSGYQQCFRMLTGGGKDCELIPFDHRSAVAAVCCLL